MKKKRLAARQLDASCDTPDSEPWTATATAARQRRWELHTNGATLQLLPPAALAARANDLLFSRTRRRAINRASTVHTYDGE